MKIITVKSLLKALAAVTGNISAGWFGLALVTPNFVELNSHDTLVVLTADLAFGILFLVITSMFEGVLSNGK